MSRYFKKAATFSALLTFAAGILLTSCNANSDAVRVLDADNTSLRATIAAYQSIGPTATAQSDALIAKMQQSDSDLATARAQVRDLTAQLNALHASGAPAGSQASVSVPAPSGAQPNPAVAADGSVTGANQPQVPADPNAFAVATLVTAKSKDSSGCAGTPSTVFSLTDPSIWVVADVRNYKKGTAFDVKWTGGDSFTYSNSWTVQSDGKQICVHFYIEPKTVGLKNGSYTVTITANGTSTQASFTVQDATSASGQNAQGATAQGSTNTNTQGQTGQPTSAASGNGYVAPK